MEIDEMMGARRRALLTVCPGLGALYTDGELDEIGRNLGSVLEAVVSRGVPSHVIESDLQFIAETYEAAQTFGENDPADLTTEALVEEFGTLIDEGEADENEFPLLWAGVEKLDLIKRPTIHMN